ncbi:MAG TPA: ubiquinol oxidase subunit II [Burkholderiaceae bacterium]|nr:ubiquinol oxidase subunit II [Burkholderiaceae bacterium]
MTPTIARPLATAAAPAARRRPLLQSLTVLAALAGCQPAVLDSRGPVSLVERTILLNSLAIMLAIVVPTMIATLAFAWWYRASNAKARRRPDWAFSGRIELVVWSIPLMVITLLGGVTWIASHQLDPRTPLAAEAPPLDLQVVSLDWKWLFIYPNQQVAVVNRLVVPAGVPLRLTLTSASVMNTFFVPQLGSMIYTMNGMATTLHLMADGPGNYAGRSAHFSGDGFADMHFQVHALAPAEFTAWVASTQAGRGPPLDDDAYVALSRQGIVEQPVTYGRVAPGLFDRIVSQDLPPGPGPEATERMGH